MRRIGFAAFMAWAASPFFGIVQAHGQDRPSTTAPGVTRAAIARYDLNHDGVLNAAEKAAYRRDILEKMLPMRQAALRQYDSNGNGKLEADERLAMQQARQTQHVRSEARALEKFDANHNGTLEPEEQASRKAAREAWLSQTKTQILERFDANRNGLLDPSEKATMRLKAEEGRAAALAAYDRNSDGRLDASERAAAASSDPRSPLPTGSSAAGEQVTAAAGGDVLSEGGGARLSLPAGALATDARIAVTSARTGELREGGRRILGIYHVHWNGPALKKPATLGLSYAPVASTVSAANLVIGRWSGDAWKEQGGTVAATDQRVSAPVTEPGRYALMERASAPARAAVVSNLRLAPSAGKGYATGADIKFSLASAGGVSVKVFDPAGRHIRSVRSRESMSEGDHVVRWDGRGSDGRSVSNGLYLIVVEAPGNKLTKKLMFLR